MADPLLHVLIAVAHALTAAYDEDTALSAVTTALEIIDPYLRTPQVRPEVAKIINLPVVTKLDLPPERILRAAIEADLTSCVIVGEMQDAEPYFASSVASGPDALWLLAHGQRRLLNISGAD
jgi:hypothetical protein